MLIVSEARDVRTLAKAGREIVDLVRPQDVRWIRKRFEWIV